MSRSKWKGPVLKQKALKSRIIVKRYSEITPNCVGKTLWGHNGKDLIKIEVKEEMLRHKFGEFIPTRKPFTFKKKKKKK